MAEDSETDLQKFQKAGGVVKHCPPQQKPRESSVPYPYSGGKPKPIESYPEPREFSPAMRLLKMSPKGISIQGAGGGRVEISQMDVAAALAAPIRTKKKLKSLSKEAYQFGLAKYLDDEAAIQAVLYMAWNVAVNMATAEGWKIKTGSHVLRLSSRVALLKVLKHEQLHHCTHCMGTGRNRKGDCKPCKGTGKRELKHREIARALGTDVMNYRRRWEPRVARMETIFECWDEEILGHLYYQFKKM